MNLCQPWQFAWAWLAKYGARYGFTHDMGELLQGLAWAGSAWPCQPAPGPPVFGLVRVRL